MLKSDQLTVAARAVALFLGLISIPFRAVATERQITAAATGHTLTNINVWSKDSQWIVYDLRSSDTFDGQRIEQVNVTTGEVQRLYESKNGAACGVATYDPTGPRVIFIEGPENPTRDWNYAMTRRRGVIVETQPPHAARPLDAAVYAPPFVRGALRGGSHVHVFSPDGQWVSFTYEDNVLAASDDATGRDLNQRNVGVSVPAGPVRVSAANPRNQAGDYFTVLVTQTKNAPRPGSDEIDRAFEEGWIGNHGYLHADGTRQERALAFQGNVVSSDGKVHAEVFVVDLPSDLTRAGDEPLEGTATRRPAPPAGVIQRRLTFTGNQKFPGVAQVPRHWLRTSADGSQIAFLMKDESGVAQFFMVSPNGGALTQLTHAQVGVESAFTWSPDGKSIAYVSDRSVWLVNATTHVSHRLTPISAAEDAPSALACVFSPDGKHLAYTRDVKNGTKKFAQIFTVDVP